MSLGASANRYGRDNEHAVLGALLRFPLPWAFDHRLALEDEEPLGIDVMVETWFGDLPLQVKSSGKRAAEHMRRHPDIPVVIVQRHDSDRRIARKSHAALRWRLENVEGVCPVGWPEVRV